MAITYRPAAGRGTHLDADAVRSTFRRLGGRGIERAYGWTPVVVAILREDRT
jgi:hypothetical protein